VIRNFILSLFSSSNILLRLLPAPLQVHVVVEYILYATCLHYLLLRVVCGISICEKFVTYITHGVYVCVCVCVFVLGDCI
jgi:thiosulfate reductase cytochrome b subunit